MAKSTRDLWVGFDLGGTKMLAVVYDRELKPLGRKRRKSKGADGPEAGLERVRLTIMEALEEVGAAKERLAGVGIACPGPIDPDKGSITELPNLGWTHVPVRRLLKKALGAPIAVLNDVDAGTYGEYRFGAARGARCALGVFPGTGVGGGCILNDRIIQGRHHSCLEIGHLAVQPQGAHCGCGQRGCLETVASRLAISQAAAAAAYRGEAPWLLREAGTDLRTIRSGVLAGAIEHGDTVVEKIVRDAARWLGVGVACVVNLLLPDIVVLGGGLVEAMPEIFRSEVSAAARGHVMRAYGKSFRVRVAELGDDAGVMGAAAWAANGGAR